MAKIAVITYSTYGHITALAKEIIKGIESEGSQADLYRVAETLPEEVLGLMHAPEKPTDIPVITADKLTQYDGILFGIPTRFGNIPAQLSAFFDSTGSLWATGGLYGKPAGIFVSTSAGAGNELTVRAALTFLVHHGMLYVPIGGKYSSKKFDNLHPQKGSSPWGAGTTAGSDGSLTLADVDADVGFVQGSDFAKFTSKYSGEKTTSSPKKTVESAEKSDKPVAAVAATAPAATPAAATDNAPKVSEKESSSCCVIV